MKTPAQIFMAKFGVYPIAAMTLRCVTIDGEGVRMSYLRELKECVSAGLVVFQNNGVGHPVLTDLGRLAVTEVVK